MHGRNNTLPPVLKELQVGCRQPEEFSPGLVRYRIASKVVKGQPLGGTQDEWVVIQPVYQAVELAEQLHDDPREGGPLFGRFEFGVRYKWFRNWVNSPAGQRAGLAPIPEAPVSLRALRHAGNRAGLPARRSARHQDRFETCGHGYLELSRQPGL